MKQFYLCCLFSLMSAVLCAQDIHWSQFEYAPLQLHPAQTGLFNGNYRVAANYRSQWFDVPVAYRTVAVSFDAHLLPFQLENDVWGLGVSFFSRSGGRRGAEYAQYFGLHGLYQTHYQALFYWCWGAGGLWQSPI